MKIQCGCGTKYAFDVTPDMVRSPVRFICQACGQDNSALINQLIQQQFAADPASAASSIQTVPSVPPLAHAPGAPPVVIAPPPPGSRPAAVPAAPTAPAAPVVRLATAGPAAASPTVPPEATHPASAPAAVPVAPLRTATPLRVSGASAAAAPAAGVAAPQVCARHAPQLTTHSCLVCQKPICPKCMEIFGYVCSAYCKGKAEDQGIRLPAFAGQRDLAQSKQWRRIYAAVGVLAALVLVGAGTWLWYAWIGSIPKVAYAAKLTDTALAGEFGRGSADQLVFLHAGTLARHDPKAAKEVWSNLLIDRQRIAAEAKQAYEKDKAAYQTAMSNGEDLGSLRAPDYDEIVLTLETDAASQLRLYQRGENVWIAYPDKLVRFDWQTGKSAQEIKLDLSRGTRLLDGDHLYFLASREGAPAFMQFNLASGEVTSEELQDQGVRPVLSQSSTNNLKNRSGASARPAGSDRAGAGEKPIDPKAAAANYQKLSTPQRLALPAVAAANANQQRLTAEMRDPQASPAAAPAQTPIPTGASEPVVLSKSGPLLLSARLLEAKVVTRKVMKDPPKKSALNGELNASATASVANEVLNEMQRDRVGDTEEENVSRYQVTLKRPAAKGVEDWQGAVSGLPAVFSLDTVDVIAAAKSVVVLDRRNKKLWEAKLNYNVCPAQPPRFGFSSGTNPNGEGPCAERGDTLYVCDEGVVTAFELASGTVRWRLPSVGTTGLFFDEQGMIYVNTTTATPDNIKYSRQIDVSDKLRELVLKVEAKTGKTLWRAVDEGLVAYVSGKFLYTVDAHPGQGSANELFAELTSMFDIPPHIRVRRLDLGSGRVLWQHYEKRAPLDVRFERNSFQVLFKHEVQNIRFISL